MKRAICLLIIASLILTASCGETSTGDETTKATENVDETTMKAEEYSFAELDLSGDTFAILNSSDTYGSTIISIMMRSAANGSTT